MSLSDLRLLQPTRMKLSRAPCLCNRCSKRHSSLTASAASIALPRRFASCARKRAVLTLHGSCRGETTPRTHGGRQQSEASIGVAVHGAHGGPTPHAKYLRGTDHGLVNRAETNPGPQSGRRRRIQRPGEDQPMGKRAHLFRHGLGSFEARPRWALSPSRRGVPMCVERASSGISTTILAPVAKTTIRHRAWAIGGARPRAPQLRTKPGEPGGQSWPNSGRQLRSK